MRKCSIQQTVVKSGIFLMMTIWMASSVYAADDTAALKNEIKELKNKVADLEKKLNQPNQEQSAPLYQQPTAPQIITPWTRQEEYDPFAEMEQMQQEMNRMFNNSFWRGQGKMGLVSPINTFDPSADIQDTKDGYVIKVEMPGMDKADINVEVKEHHLIISGEKKSDTEEKNKNTYYRRERSFGYFNRVMPLPEDANPEKINADYTNGVLTVKIGKLENKKKENTTQKIEIK